MGSQIVIQMPRPVAFGIREHRGGGGVAVPVPTGEQEDRQCLALHLFPQDRGDLPAYEFCVCKKTRPEATDLFYERRGRATAAADRDDTRPAPDPP